MKITIRSLRTLIREEVIRESVRDLSNVEFLALSIAKDPGQSGRHYLRLLSKYKGESSDGSHGAIYFAPSGRYFGKLWVDQAKSGVPFDSFSAHGKRPKDTDPERGRWGMSYLRPQKSEWHLTPAGEKVAQRAQEKLTQSRNRKLYAVGDMI